MTLNRLVHPASDHAMPDWIRRTALADILGTDFSALGDGACLGRSSGIRSIMAKIWDPFFTAKAEGTGTGLSIVRSLVEQQR